MSADLVRDAEFTESGKAFMPAMTISQAVVRYDGVLEFTKKIMKDGKDFGTIPGTDKPCLLKPGAEKLCSFFGLTPRFVIVEKSEDWTGQFHGGEQFFYYHYRAQLFRGEYLLGEAEGSCNSMESKYRFRWVQEDQIPPGLDKASLKRRGGRISEFSFAIDKAETGGKYGKPMSHWQAFRDAISAGRATQISKPTKNGKTMDAWEIDSTLFRIPNPDIADQVNSIQKMGQKRALVAATLVVCNASEYYTQDIEDMEYLEGHSAPIAKPTPQKPPETKSDGEIVDNDPPHENEAEHKGYVRESVLPNLHIAAMQGTEAYQTAFKALTPEQRLSIKGDHQSLKDIAAKADAAKKPKVDEQRPDPTPEKTAGPSAKNHKTTPPDTAINNDTPFLSDDEVPRPSLKQMHDQIASMVAEIGVSIKGKFPDGTEILQGRKRLADLTVQESLACIDKLKQLAES